LTGRQKDPSLVIKYHSEISNKFAVPPKDLWLFNVATIF
jgi:hypothetical protein